MKAKLTLLAFVLSLAFSYAQNDRKPFKIGDEFPVNVSATREYHNQEKGIVFQKTFSKKNASYVKLHLNSFDLQQGDYLRVYSPKTQEEYIYAEKGKIVGKQKQMINTFWTGTIWSDTIIVELHSEAKNLNHYGFNIDTVAYGYPQAKLNAIVSKMPPCGADDKEDIVCYDGTEIGNKSKAVCKLIINGTGACTGWLLGCDGHVMTNNHCIGDQATANNTEFLFDYKNTTCGGNVATVGDTQATSANFIQTDAALDFTLMQLPVNPTNTYGYLSLASQVPAFGERIYLPQHPLGEPKQIAVNSDVFGDTNGHCMLAFVGNGQPGDAVEYYADSEGGSSGSPVIRFDDQLVVAIHNASGCPASSASSFGRSDQLIAAIGANMPNCGVDDNNPTIPYVNAVATNSITEATNCSYQDVNLIISLAKPASNNTDVTLSVTGGSAVSGVDFDLMTTAVTFPTGDITNKNATLRVYNDAFVEADEAIEISLAVNANGGDAEIGPNNKFNLTIKDDNYNPNIGKSVTLFSDDLENGSGAFTISATNGSTDFAIGTTATATSANVDFSSNTTNFMFVNDEACACNMVDERFRITTPFDFTNYNAVEVNFDYFFTDGGITSNYAQMQVSADGGATWVGVSGNLDKSDWNNKIINLSTYAGQSNVLISFFYTDLGGVAYGFGVDNINVIGKQNADVQTSVNSGVDLALNTSGTIHSYDASSGNVLATLTNNGNDNYGCVQVNVSRAGTSGQSYNGSTAPDLVTDKTFTITATNPTTSGNSTVKFYFTEAEIAGWEVVATPNVRGQLYVLRDAGSTTEVVNATLGNYNGNVTLQANFTGINGTYYFGTQNTLLNIIENDFGNLFSIAPNPVGNYLTINYTQGNLPNKVSIYNMIGQTIFTKKIQLENDLTINTQNMANGMYFVKINTKTAQQTFKIIKK